MPRAGDDRRRAEPGAGRASGGADGAGSGGAAGAGGHAPGRIERGWISVY